MITTVSGYSVKPIAVANTTEELSFFTTLEASITQDTRIIVEVPLDPSEDVISVAQQVQAACEKELVLFWPEHPNTYTFVENNTLYIAYVKPAGEVTPSIAWMMIIIGVIIIAPIIMYFAVPGFAELVNGVIMLVVMMLMFDMMGPMLKSSRAQTVPAEPRVPIEQRISRKIESIAESIERTERAFEKSKSSGVATVSSVVSDITGVARAIKGAPSTAMSGYQKSKAAGQLDVLDDRLEKYKEHLTPSQLRNLEEEQRIVDELRAMYD